MEGELNEQSLSNLLQALEEAYRLIRDRHPEVCPAFFVIFENRPIHTASFQSSCRQADRIGRISRISISIDLIMNGSEALLCELLHSAAHSLNQARSIKDTSREGRYHNRQFRSAAEEVGLTVKDDPSYGSVPDNLTPDAVEEYAEVLKALENVLNEVEPAVTSMISSCEAEPAGENRLIKAVCECGRIIRGARKTLLSAPIICASCSKPFIINGK